MNRHVAALSEMQTGCDRIANTPIPFAYSVLLESHRILFLFYAAI
jgi:putative membrane protein